ncbi:MAG: S8/S53 family peptidase [Rhodanobacteraceae bacterium]|nr:S8/S53 family peptidase [Rhodanobacteraceae bacterium]
MALPFLIRCVVCLAFTMQITYSIAQPLTPPQPVIYEHWCGVQIVKELPDAETAASFIRAQGRSYRFIRDGRLVLLREQPSLAAVDSYFGQSSLPDVGIYSTQTISTKKHFWKGFFSPVDYSPREELYSIPSGNHASPAGGEPTMLDINDTVWKQIGAIKPASSIRFTRRPRVAVLDTEIFGHREFERAGKTPQSLINRYSLDPIGPSADCAAGYCCHEDNSQIAPNSAHGTQVAGLIAAADDGKGISGLGDVEQLLSISTQHPDLQCFSRRRLVAAYKCAVQRRADIINISMETELSQQYPQDFEDAIKEVESSLRWSRLAPLVVVAAGNRGCKFNSPHDCRVWPGGMNLPTILTVEALNLSGTRLESSNRGHFVDLAVPAEKVCTTTSTNPVPPFVPACDNGYTTFGETSAAAAMVTGAATRVWGHPNFDRCNAAQIRRVLRGYGESTPIALLENGEQPSCKMNIDFLYTVKRDAKGNAINLCARPDMDASHDGCGDLRKQVQPRSRRTPKKSLRF